MELYVLSGCTTCRDAEHILEESGIVFSKRDFFRDTFTPEELRSLFNRAGVTPLQVVATRSVPYRELGLKSRTDLTDEILFELMLEYPALIRRPVVLGTGGAVFGLDKERIRELADQERDS